MIALKLPPKLEAQVRDLAAQQGVAVDEYIVDVVRQRFILEAELLARIRHDALQEIRGHYLYLNEKRQTEYITDEEHSELLSLIERIEQTDAERMTHLVELAQLRNVSLDVVLNDLNLP